MLDLNVSLISYLTGGIALNKKQNCKVVNKLNVLLNKNSFNSLRYEPKKIKTGRLLNIKCWSVGSMSSSNIGVKNEK